LLGQYPKEKERIPVPHNEVEGLSHGRGATPRIKGYRNKKAQARIQASEARRRKLRFQRLSSASLSVTSASYRNSPKPPNSSSEVVVQSTAGFLLFLTVLVLPAAFAADRPSRWRAVWRVSQAMLTGADAADAASSWGKTEANPLVRTGPRFSYGSLAIKVAVLSGGLAAQHYILRKVPNKTPLFASANLAAAAMLGVVAEHNMHVPRQ
jgi:hypothetical protein